MCVQALISVTPDEETYDEEDAAFCLEMLLRIVLENRYTTTCVSLVGDLEHVHVLRAFQSFPTGSPGISMKCVCVSRDRVSCVWQTVRDHLCHLCVHATESCFLVERAVVGLLRLAIRLLRREDISSQVHSHTLSHAHAHTHIYIKHCSAPA